MQDSTCHLLPMYKPEGTLLASLEVCSDLARCVFLYKADLNKFCYCNV